MTEPAPRISQAFQTFLTEAPQHAQAWGGMVQGLAQAGALDTKTAAWPTWQCERPCGWKAAFPFMSGSPEAPARRVAKRFPWSRGSLSGCWVRLAPHPSVLCGGI
jgi:hypothetical protein